MFKTILTALIVLAAAGGVGAAPAPLRLASGNFVTCETPNGERYQASGHCMTGDSVVTPCFIPGQGVRWVRSQQECDSLGGRYGRP